MIGRVARALAECYGDPLWQSHVPGARAAVCSMLEPTCKMLEAATGGLPDWGYVPEKWRAVIDHILAEIAD